MSQDQAVGTIVLTVNGREFDCASVSPSKQAGRKPVSTMNSQGRVRKWARTTRSIALDVEVYVDEDDRYDWAGVEDAQITIESINGGKRTTYLGVYVTEVGEQYGDGEVAKRSIKCFALDEVEA
jgi:hypothetical protein